MNKKKEKPCVSVCVYGVVVNPGPIIIKSKEKYVVFKRENNVRNEERAK